jgi:hypothetical protein
MLISFNFWSGLSLDLNLGPKAKPTWTWWFYMDIDPINEVL